MRPCTEKTSFFILKCSSKIDDYIATIDCGGGSGDEEPKTFVEIIKNPRWMKAMHEEMDSI
jgi:hypothetical protein